MENPQILLIGSDPALMAEFEAATQGLRRMDPLLHHAHDRRQGVELARSRRPDLVIVESPRDLQTLKALAGELLIAAPNCQVIATYDKSRFSGDESESQFLIEAMRARVTDFMQRPISSGELQEMLDRTLNRAKSHSARMGKVLSFVSNKGGAGKSTISVNTAVGLAMRHPGEVLLVDTSLQLGVAAMMLDLAPKTTIVDAIRESHRLDETLLRQLTVQSECGLHVLAAPPDAVEASHVDDEGFSRILTLARRAYRYVVVDTYPMLDSVIMAALDLSDLVYVVFHGTVPSVVGNAHFIDVLRKVGVSQSRQRVVLNYNFPKVSGALRVEDVVNRLNREVDHVFPYQKRILTALNTGRPYALKAGRRWGFGKALNGIVDEIEQLPSGHGSSVEFSERSADGRVGGEVLA